MNNAIVKCHSSLVRYSTLLHRTCINQKGYLKPNKEFKKSHKLITYATSNFSNFMLFDAKRKKNQTQTPTTFRSNINSYISPYSRGIEGNFSFPITFLSVTVQGKMIKVMADNCYAPRESLGLVH